MFRVGTAIAYGLRPHPNSWVIRGPSCRRLSPCGLGCAPEDAGVAQCCVVRSATATSPRIQRHRPHTLGSLFRHPGRSSAANGGTLTIMIFSYFSSWSEAWPRTGRCWSGAEPAARTVLVLIERRLWAFVLRHRLFMPPVFLTIQFVYCLRWA